MARYEITLNSEQLPGLLTEDKGLHGLVDTVLNQELDAQATEQIGTRPYERSEGRRAYRNGSRPRTLTTRVGPLGLHVPQVRDGSFSTALSPGTNGVSKRWYCPVGDGVKWRVDAEGRDHHRGAVRHAVFPVDGESEGTWTDMFAWLKGRGLHGIEVLVSDDHVGLVKAPQRAFQGVIWQRCQVHFQRNVLGRTPRHLRAQMAAGQRLVNEVLPQFPRFLLRNGTPIHFYLVDLDAAICIDLRQGTVEANQRVKKDCDLALYSQALWFAFKYPKGYAL